MTTISSKDYYFVKGPLFRQWVEKFRSGEMGWYFSCSYSCMKKNVKAHEFVSVLFSTRGEPSVFHPCVARITVLFHEKKASIWYIVFRIKNKVTDLVRKLLFSQSSLFLQERTLVKQKLSSDTIFSPHLSGKKEDFHAARSNLDSLQKIDGQNNVTLFKVPV